jgi:hypothetical protein
LESGTTYQVRSRATDCIGAELISPVSEFTTPDPVPHLSTAELTISLSDDDQNDVVLRWNTEVEDAEGNTIPASGFEIYHNTTLDPIDQLIGFVTGGEFTYSIIGAEIGFFQVVPIIEDFGQPHPFIAWPPDGATVRGMNTIIIKDYLHSDESDSFRITLDPDAAATLLGTNLDDPYSENDKTGILYDFAEAPPGVNTIAAEVISSSRMTSYLTTQIQVNVVHDRPYVRFEAEFDPVLNRFYCDTIGGENLGDVVAIWWQNTQGQEGYGPTFSFTWAGPDSLVMIKPIPVSSVKVLTFDSPTEYLDPFEFAGVNPVPTDFEVPYSYISCCCVNLDIKATGTAEGTYHGQSGRTLGPFVRCLNGKFFVSYAFEVDITWKYYMSEDGATCSYGQDIKRTNTSTIGRCVDGAFEPYVKSNGEHIVETSHKSEGTTEYPRSGADYGNDHYGNRTGDAGVDNSKLGHSRWFDRPRSHGALPKNSTTTFATRQQRSARFIAQAAPPCEVDGCCKTWDLDWDVTFCADCTIIQTSPPAITNIVTPASCPALAE